MSLSVLLIRNKLVAGLCHPKLLGCATEIRRLHDGKAEMFDKTANYSLNSEKHNVQNSDLVNRKFFSGTTQDGEDNKPYQKIERIGYKALAKSENLFTTILKSNEVSVIKAVGRKLCNVVCNTFKKNVWENERVMTIRKDVKQKYEQAKQQECRK